MKILSKFPISYPTVDIACIDLWCTKGIRILLAKKKGETFLRFPGGFVDISDPSLEAAAAREMMEEVSIKAISSEMKYVASMPIEDSRYSGKNKRILTSLFAYFVYKDQVEEVAAADDINFVGWFNVPPDPNTLRKKVNPKHRCLFDAIDLYLPR